MIMAFDTSCCYFMSHFFLEKNTENTKKMALETPNCTCEFPLLNDTAKVTC